jgi:hypothetical protein
MNTGESKLFIESNATGSKTSLEKLAIGLGRMVFTYRM